MYHLVLTIECKGIPAYSEIANVNISDGRISVDQFDPPTYKESPVVLKFCLYRNKISILHYQDVAAGSVVPAQVKSITFQFLKQALAEAVAKDNQKTC